MKDFILPDNNEQLASKLELATEAFILPDIGEGIVECEITSWLVKPGDTVKEDQAIVEVMTDKALVEIPAKYTGKITKLYYKEGEIAAVHSPLFEQEIEKTKKPQDPTKADTKQAHTTQAHTSKVLASPAVRRVARELGIDLQEVVGSGTKGRVLKHDLHSFNKLENAQTQDLSLVAEGTCSLVAEAKNAADLKLVARHGYDREETITGIRAAMAKQMSHSIKNAVHFTVSDELCMDKLIAMRKLLQSEFEKESIKLSFMPFFIKALSMAIDRYPILNSRFNAELSTINYLASHNIGIAVDSKIGLLVPNIKNVETKSIYDIAIELNAIIEKAREGKLSHHDLSGGTITLSNIGAIGGMSATPIINPPEVAIAALGKTQKLPRFNEKGEVSASHIMMVNWSGDHRIIDGATMVRFNNLWMSLLQEPEKMLVKLR